MKDWLAIIAFNVVTIIQIMALLVVAFGTIQAFLLSAVLPRYLLIQK